MCLIVVNVTILNVLVFIMPNFVIVYFYFCGEIWQACSWHGLWDFLKQNALQKVTNAFMLMITFR